MLEPMALARLLHSTQLGNAPQRSNAIDTHIERVLALRRATRAQRRELGGEAEPAGAT
ncbi:MAG: hypothetical protein HRT86_02525 [Ilumatobacteraceae bacterium]|nr:hypothetical protein [Ilumatobacteraceae bacterium]